MSFIIPAHDEERLIGETVATLRTAAGHLGLDAEIIVACDACTDGTRHIAEQAGARTIEIEHRQIAASRNAGAKAATGELLFFVDADTLVPTDSIAQAMAAIQSGALGGGAPFVFEGPIPLYARPLGALMRLISRVTQLTGGCFLFVKRDAFDAAGGWDETLFVSEEIALAKALKKHGRFVIVRTPVHTSGRKVRTHSGREILMLLLRAVVRPSMVRDRSGLDLWYGPRRKDPFERGSTPGPEQPT